MKILIDECDSGLAKQLVGHDVKTVQQMGWSAMKDPELLSLAEAEFEVFLTQESETSAELERPKDRVVVLPSNRLSIVQRLVQRLMLTLQTIQPNLPGQTIELSNS